MNTGETIGPYVVLDLLGSGGMARVYRARDTRLEREVALKRLSDTALADDEARERVIREARAAAALTHANIAAVHDVVETPQGLVIVMEYVPGESLAGVLSRGPLPVEQALRVTGEIADALAEAHARGIVHRDLKPANVMITPSGRAKILDFGIARSVLGTTEHRPGQLTTAGSRQIIGTLGYMAPEQLLGGRVDRRTDIFGLGILLFEMLTGQRAFDASDFAGQFLAVSKTRASRLRDLAPHVPPEVAALVARAMAVNPEERFATAHDVRTEVERVLRGLSSAPTVQFASPPRESLLSRLGVRPFRRGRAAILAVGLLAAAAAVVAVVPRVLDRPHGASQNDVTIIGVLPFRNDSGQAAHDQVVAGLPEALVNRLATAPSLRVLPLQEVREAMGENSDAAAVARSLGASYAVEGAILPGATPELELVLVSHAGGRRSAGRYSAERHLLELHQNVADGLVRTLTEEGALRPAGTSERRPPTESPEAFAEYAQARAFLERPDVPGNLGHAIRLFQSAVAKDQRFALAYAGLAEAYWAQYQETSDPQWTGKAMAANLEALRIDSSQAEVRMSLAVMYSGQGRTDEAVEELKRVIELQPQNDNPHRVLSEINVERSDWDAAIGEANAAVKLRPSYWRNHRQLGYAYFRAGRFDDAIRAWERVVELQPDSARGYQNLGTAFQAAGRHGAATETYAKAISIRPSARSYSNLGTIFFWSGDYRKAADAFEKAVALAPRDSGMHANLGDAYMKLGLSAKAQQSYRDAVDLIEGQLQVNARDAQLLASLALYRAKLGEHREAADALRNALDSGGRDGSVLYVAALVGALAGDHGAACAAIGQALENGAIEEEIRHAHELSPVKGCEAYDRVAATHPQEG